VLNKKKALHYVGCKYVIHLVVMHQNNAAVDITGDALESARLDMGNRGGEVYVRRDTKKLSKAQ
jgi:hypothetical protein